MAMTYVNIQDRVEQILQDTSATTYTTTITGMWIEDALKEFSPYDPHIVDVIFKIESRTGTDVTGTGSSLTDTVKDQFLDADDDDEKVIHNTTDNTWAVVKTYTDETVLVLTADIMDANEQYTIYNKRCWNEKQIYIGDVLDYLWIDSVEYPIGTKRNWKVYGEVLEIDVDSVDDSDSTLTTLGQVDVLVRFAKPHRVCQLANLVGELTADESKGDTRIAVDGLTQGTGIVVEIGDEFHLENHRTLYTITSATTLNGGAGNITFYPSLEADASDNDDITFTKSTLQPRHEELFCHLVAARGVLSQNITNINAINKGGADVWLRYQNWGERKLAEVISKMERLSPPRTKRRYPTA